MTGQATRTDWIDAAKGLAILLVVIGHAWRGVHARGLIPPDLFTAVDLRIYAFHMPVFFAASGMFFTRSLARMSPSRFLASRLTRMLWPMVLWTYLFLAFKVIAGSRANTPTTLSDMMIWPIPGYLHLWFLWALLLLHLAFLLTRPLLSKDGHYALPTLAVLGGVSLCLSLLPLPREVSYWVGNALRFAPFFVLGLWLSQSAVLTRISRVMQAGAALCFGAVLVFWPPTTASLSLLGSLVLTLCFLIAFAGAAQWFQGRNRWLVTLGAASMAIYLAHTIFSAALREALLMADIRDLTTHIVLGTAIGIVGPLITLWIARRLGLVRILGF